MNHPHEQLADLLDGTLDEASLAGVQAHLDTCEECRADVEAARRGREAARSLPVAEPPGDLHERVVAAAGGGGRGGAPRWYRWVGAAAAAAVVLAIAIALPNVGNDAGDGGGSAAGVTADSSAGGAAESGAEEPMPAAAERVAQLDGIAMGTLQAVSKASKLAPYPTDIRKSDDHIGALVERYAAVSRSAREGIDTADEAGDADTADIFTAFSRALDKDLWFLKSHLQ